MVKQVSWKGILANEMVGVNEVREQARRTIHKPQQADNHINRRSAQMESQSRDSRSPTER